MLSPLRLVAFTVAVLAAAILLGLWLSQLVAPQEAVNGPGQPSASSGSDYTLDENPPADGAKAVLSLPGLRWCAFENVRVEAMRTVVDTDTQRGVYNRALEAHNRKCVGITYDKSDMDKVQAELAARRALLQQQGVGRLEFLR
jgi:hypothetical protein